MLNYRSRHPSNNFRFNKGLFGAADMVKIVKKKSMCIVAMVSHLITKYRLVKF